MTLVQLEYILAVDTYRHFVKAAEHCNVTQPTLSMQIKKFEEELDILIFDRNKQPIEPTPVGKRIIEQAHLLLQGKDRIHSLIDDARENIAGDLRIGIIPTIATNLSSIFIPVLAEKYPELKIKVEEVMTQDLVQKIKTGKLDMGIIATPLNEDGIDEWPVYYEPFVLYTSPKSKLAEKEKISSRDLKIEDLWLLDEGHCFTNHVINLCEVKSHLPNKMNFSYKTGSLDILMQFVDQNYGYTLLPYLSQLHMGQEQKKNIREFKEPMPKREIGIITPQGFIKQKLLETIKAEIRACIPKNLLNLDNGHVIHWKS